jgi:transcriptional regulator with XRE-family HTH domain
MRVEYTQLFRNGELKARRIALRLRQRDIAEACQISVPAVAQIESFRAVSTDAPAVCKVAKFLGIAPETLVPRWLKDVAAIPSKVTIESSLDEEGMRKLAESAHGMLASGARCVEEVAIAEEEAQRLVKAYGMLPIEHRKIMKLYAEGFSHGQIAKATGYSKTRVFQIVMYAVGRFMVMLPETREYHRDEIASLLAYGLHKNAPARIRIPRGAPARGRGIRVSIPTRSACGNAQAGDMVRLHKDGRRRVHRRNIKMAYMSFGDTLRPIMEKILLEEDAPITLGTLYERCEKAGLPLRAMSRKDVMHRMSNIIGTITGAKKQRRGWTYYWSIHK